MTPETMRPSEHEEPVLFVRLLFYWGGEDTESLLGRSNKGALLRVTPPPVNVLIEAVLTSGAPPASEGRNVLAGGTSRSERFYCSGASVCKHGTSICLSSVQYKGASARFAGVFFFFYGIGLYGEFILLAGDYRVPEITILLYNHEKSVHTDPRYTWSFHSFE